ncbi:MAG: hypothetical protein KDC38_17545, partial [Planctomycetes bacterium]|nr:hypothetical protein [Planctomycetota bacterium]
MRQRRLEFFCASLFLIGAGFFITALALHVDETRALRESRSPKTLERRLQRPDDALHGPRLDRGDQVTL